MAKKLNFELVPDSCWCSNLRTILSKKQWDYIRKDAIERAGKKCSICGKQTSRLEAHEQWIYDEEKCVQKLSNVIAVCKDCHSAIHIGRTSLVGDVESAENHYMKINDCSYAEMRKDLGQANIEHQRRNKKSDWKLDLSWLERFILE